MEKNKIRINYFKAITLCVILSITSTVAPAQAPTVKLGSFAGYFGYPIAVVTCGDGRLFLGERDGRIKMTFKSGNLYPDYYHNMCWLDIAAFTANFGSIQLSMVKWFHFKNYFNCSCRSLFGKH